MSEDWFKWDGVHTKVDITGLAMGASYTGWALEYKSMFGTERSLHVNPNAALSYLGIGADSTAWKGNLLKSFTNELSVHVSDSASLGVGSSLDVHRSAIHYSSNREKNEYFSLLLGYAIAFDLLLVILSNLFYEKDPSGIKISFYMVIGISNLALTSLQYLEFRAKEITYVLTNLEANLAATTSRLKTLAGYETNILDQLHPMVGSQRLQAAKTILESCENDAEKAIKTAKKVALQLAGAPAP